MGKSLFFKLYSSLTLFPYLINPCPTTFPTLNFQSFEHENIERHLSLFFLAFSSITSNVPFSLYIYCNFLQSLTSSECLVYTQYYNFCYGLSIWLNMNFIKLYMMIYTAIFPIVLGTLTIDIPLFLIRGLKSRH